MTTVLCAMALRIFLRRVHPSSIRGPSRSSWFFVWLAHVFDPPPLLLCQSTAYQVFVSRDSANECTPPQPHSVCPCEIDLEKKGQIIRTARAWLDDLAHGSGGGGDPRYFGGGQNAGCSGNYDSMRKVVSRIETLLSAL